MRRLQQFLSIVVFFNIVGARFRDDLLCVEWDFQLYLFFHSIITVHVALFLARPLLHVIQSLSLGRRSTTSGTGDMSPPLLEVPNKQVQESLKNHIAKY